MLGMYLTTVVNFLAKTMTEGMTGIWTGLTSALWKVVVRKKLRFYKKYK